MPSINIHLKLIFKFKKIDWLVFIFIYLYIYIIITFFFFFVTTKNVRIHVWAYSTRCDS